MTLVTCDRENKKVRLYFDKIFKCKLQNKNRLSKMSLYCTIFRSLRTLSLRPNLPLPSCLCLQNVQSTKKYFSSKPPAVSVIKEIDPHTGEVKKKKATTIPRITLLSGDSISVTTLDEAQKISKRRDLKLVKVIDLDTKSQRPVYKLMTGAEFHEEDLKQRERKKQDRQNTYIKGEKVLLMTSKISEHDLETQVRKAVKWVDKMYEVRVVINSPNSNQDQAEKVYSDFENHFRESGNEGKFVQKRVKGSDIKFQIMPPKKKIEDATDTQDL